MSGRSRRPAAQRLPEEDVRVHAQQERVDRASKLSRALRPSFQYGRVIGTMDPTSSHNGSSRTFRASQGSDKETWKAAHRSYPRWRWSPRFCLRSRPMEPIQALVPLHHDPSREGHESLAVCCPGTATSAQISGPRGQSPPRFLRHRPARITPALRRRGRVGEGRSTLGLVNAPLVPFPLHRWGK